MPRRASSCPASPSSADRLTRVDVQLGDQAGRYLSAAAGVPSGAYILRDVRPGELVPLSAVGAEGDVSVQPLTLVVDARSAAPLVVGSVVDVYVNPVAADGDAAGRDFAGAELALESVSVAGLPQSGGRLERLAGRPCRAGHGAQGPHPRPHRPGRPRRQGDPGPGAGLPAGNRPVSTAVLTAVSHHWETQLVTSLESSAGLTVVRRCADLADLLAAASAGLADVAIVSSDLRALDRAALHHLASHGVRAAGAVAPGDEAGERHLRQLGLDVVVRSDAPAHEIEEALAGLETPEVSESLLAADVDGAADEEALPPEAGAWQPVVESRLLAVWGPTGAPGRSTVALGLAAELAATGARTLLVDCDTYGSSIAQSLSLLDEAPGMAAAARAADQGTLDLPALARLAPEVSDRLRVLTGIPRAERWPELRAPAVEHVLTVARQLAEFVVVDCGFSIEDDEELSYDTLAPTPQRRHAHGPRAGRRPRSWWAAATPSACSGWSGPCRTSAACPRRPRAWSSTRSAPPRSAAGPSGGSPRRSAASPGWTTCPSCRGTSSRSTAPCSRAAA